MSQSDFRAEVVDIMSDGFPSADDNLLGMTMDFDALLFDVPELNSDTVEVRSTEHAECLIRVWVPSS